MNRPTLSRAALRAAQSTEWLLLVILLAVSIPPILIRHQSLTVVSALNLIDDSWVLDTSFKAANGIWFGRDVAFTYGPLYQWLSSAPSRWLGVSMGTVYATSYTLPFFVIILSTFFAARLLLPTAPAWRRALLVLLAVVFWSPPDLRVSLCLLAFAIFVRFTDTAAAPVGAISPRAIAAAAICLLAFLLSADTGLYCVAALLLCAAFTAVITRRTRRLAKFLILAAAGFAPLMLLTNALMRSPWDFTFWRSSLAIAGGYRWFEPTTMAKLDKRLLLETLALGVAVFGAAWYWRKPAGIWTRRPAFLLSGFCLAFLMMQSSLVRSDHGHVLIGIYPMIFLCGAIALNKDEGEDQGDSARLWPLVLPSATVIATLALSHAFPMFLPREVLARAREIIQPLETCPGGSQEFDRACFPPADALLVRSVALYVGLNTPAGDPIAVFPYETAFGLASRHQVAGGVMQSYLVNGEYLSNLELTGLRQEKPPFGLYLPDGVLSIPLDGVPNFTRSPDVWFYLLRHYRLDTGPMTGALGLVREENRDSHFVLTDERIADPAGPTPIRDRRTSIDLGPIRWPSAGMEFLKLRLRLNYPSWWRLRKPSQLTLQMLFSDGSEKSIRFLIEPNRSNDVWIYPWDDKEMGSYFSENESDWPRGGRPRLTDLRLFITPFDWISVVPTSVAVESVEAVRLSLR
jgi:hypothetical protein